MAASIESGSPLVNVSILVAKCTPPTDNLTIFGKPESSTGALFYPTFPLQWESIIFNLEKLLILIINYINILHVI